MRTACALTLCFAAVAWAGDGAVLQAGFDQPDALAAWRGEAGRLVPGPRGSCLLIENADAPGGASRQLELTAARLAGKLVTVSALVRAEGVSEPPKSWNGIKVMLILQVGGNSGGGKLYPQIRLGSGTFDWTRVARTLRVPRAVVEATLLVGLEKVSGRAWFDDIEIRTGRPVVQIAGGGRRQETMFKGHGLSRLRGVMLGPRFEEKDIRDLAEWGANQVRWQLTWAPIKWGEELARDRDLEEYDRRLDGALAEADKALNACEKYGIKVLLDLHRKPGGWAGNRCRMLTERRCRDKFVQVWDRIARRYRGRSVIYAYDLVNEPLDPGGVGAIVSWADLFIEVTRRIRAVDPGKPVVFEPGSGGNPECFDELVVPLELDRVIYSFHMYKPHEFTHQLVSSSRHKTPYVYPGVVGGEMWDKDRLREAMLPAVDFQREFNVHMYVGEFSAIRWAPEGSAFRYLRDLIDLFEEYGWDWSYHAFREWPGWSVEHTTDRDDWNPSPTPTDRERLLRGWFSRNERPARRGE